MKNDQQRPLNAIDSPTRTLGCRHSNPDICRNNMTEGKCAFARSDNICLTPPMSWPKIFNCLVEGVAYSKRNNRQKEAKNAGR
jgi:hypothetical protein